jgi:hypothetical protein
MQMLAQAPGASLRENPKFWQNFKPKYNTLKGNFRLLFLFDTWHGNSGLALELKLIFYKIKLCVFCMKIFPKLTSQP